MIKVAIKPTDQSVHFSLVKYFQLEISDKVEFLNRYFLKIDFIEHLSSWQDVFLIDRINDWFW
jgi:hypothetical protein